MAFIIFQIRTKKSIEGLNGCLFTIYHKYLWGHQRFRFVVTRTGAGDLARTSEVPVRGDTNRGSTNRGSGLPKRLMQHSNPNIRRLLGAKWGGIRDHLIHHYFGIDYEILWDVIQYKIPELHGNLQLILQDNHADEEEDSRGG